MFHLLNCKEQSVLEEMNSEKKGRKMKERREERKGDQIKVENRLFPLHLSPQKLSTEENFACWKPNIRKKKDF